VLSSAPSAPRHANVIVHGDLHPRNLLVADTGTLAGVIDWVDLHRGDRAVDLATAFETLPRRARDDFFVTYGTVDEATRWRAWWRAVDHSVRALSGAIERGDLVFARIVRHALLEMAEG
jgi:aminoglycoside phosphotransferase (APT) family kinase protein